MAWRHQQNDKATDAAADRDAENRRRFTDQSGLEASQLPGHGRDEPHDTNAQREMGRNLPQQHGGDDSEIDQEGGLRGDRQISDADLHGHRGHA